MPTRRAPLKSALAAPFVNLDRYTLFAQAAPYPARAVVIESNDFMPPEQLPQMLASMDSRYHAHHREAVEHLDHPKRIYDLTEALIRRKYTNEQIRLILGENWRRVFGEIWTVA